MALWLLSVDPALDQISRRSRGPDAGLNSVVEPQLRRAESAGLLERDHARIRPTAKGQRFLNDLLEEFLAPPDAKPAERVINISSPGTARPS